MTASYGALFLLVPLLSAQVQPAVRACAESHRHFAPSNPAMGADGRFRPGQQIVQSQLALDTDSVIRVTEFPRSEEPLNSYNSTVTVQRGEQTHDYEVGRLIKYGFGLRLVEIASLCAVSPSQPGIVILAFEAGFDGSTAGFVVVRHSADATDVQASPMTNQGRIGVRRENPSSFELWSASGSIGIDCTACKKRYVIQNCRLGEEQMECKRQAETIVDSPGRFIGNRIDLR